MRFTSKTEYAVICLGLMAKNESSHSVTAKEIADEEGMSITFIEKILQVLRRAGIVASHQGNRGGWVLSRDPKNISLKEIVEATEGSTFEVFCEIKKRKKIVCGRSSLCELKLIWDATKETLDNLYQNINLADIAKAMSEANKKVEIFK